MLTTAPQTTQLALPQQCVVTSAGFLFDSCRAMFRKIVRPAAEGHSLAGNAIWLTAARVAPMAAGFLFWLVAALTLAPNELGLGSAVVAAALLTVQAGMLGVGPATLTLLPSQDDAGRRRLVATTLATVGLSSLAVATALLLITLVLGPGVGQAWDDAAVTAGFLAAALFAGTAYQLDHINVAQSRADLALVRSLLQGLTQLAVLLLCLASGYRSVIAVVGAVAAGAASSVILGMHQLHHAGINPRWKEGVRPSEARKLLRLALRNYPLMLADRAPGYLLPLIVAATLSASATAAWYVVWMMASAVFFVPQSAGYSLQTKLAAPGSTPALAGGALKISLLLTLVSGGVLLGAGPVLLKVLGPQYAPHWILLPLLVPALLLSCTTQIYYGICRAYARFAESTAVAVLAAVIAVIPGTAVARAYGLPGISALWLFAQLSAAVIAAGRLKDLTSGPGG